MPAVCVGEIVDLVAGQFAGDHNRSISGVASLAQATGDQLSFLSNRKYAADLAATKAGAVLVPKNLEGDDDRWIRVDDPYFAFARIMTRWFSNRPMPKGISPKAVVSSSAKLGQNVVLGPFAIIGDEVVIGNNVTIFQGVSIEAGSIIGDDCIIYPNVSIYDGTRIGHRCIIHSGVVIGSDGYGFALHEGKHHKIPQIGIVRIEDDVEIGAGCTIDRGVSHDTLIGKGTKMDNMIHIGHDTVTGKNCLFAAQVGIAGVVNVGNGVVIWGQAGVNKTLTIGDNAVVLAQSGIPGDLEAGKIYFGSPAEEAGIKKRELIWIKRIPELWKKVMQG